jgi:hypothetical protein
MEEISAVWPQGKNLLLIKAKYTINRKGIAVVTRWTGQPLRNGGASGCVQNIIPVTYTAVCKLTRHLINKTIKYRYMIIFCK